VTLSGVDNLAVQELTGEIEILAIISGIEGTIVYELSDEVTILVRITGLDTSGLRLIKIRRVATMHQITLIDGSGSLVMPYKVSGTVVSPLKANAVKS
jgi:hypothetical protein